MKIAVTGATGFVGKYTVNYFNEKGHDVVAIGRDQKKLENIFDDNIEKYATNYSTESLIEGLQNVNVIIHLAAQVMERTTNPFKLSQFFEGNLLLTENLLLAAKENNIPRICQASSISVYSLSNSLPFKETEAPIPSNIYGVSKIACENLATMFSDQTEVKVTTLRFARLYGVGDREGVVFMKYFNQAGKKLKLNVIGSGSVGIDYIYIRDAISAIEKAVELDSLHGIYNIGSGKSFSVRYIAESINKVFLNEGNIIYDNSAIDKPGNGYMDCSKSLTYLNWAPKWSLLDAIRDMRDLI